MNGASCVRKQEREEEEQREGKKTGHRENEAHSKVREVRA